MLLFHLQCFLDLFLIPFGILCGLQSVEQVVAEAVDSSLHCHYDSKAGVSSTEGEELSRKLETDTGAGKGASLPRKDLQKASAKGSAISIFHLLILLSVFIFFLTSECDGRRWLSGIKGSFGADIRYESYHSFFENIGA